MEEKRQAEILRKQREVQEHMRKRQQERMEWVKKKDKIAQENRRKKEMESF